MTEILSIIGLLVLLFVLSILFGTYEVKKGQIKMHDNEIPIEEITFKEVNYFYE